MIIRPCTCFRSKTNLNRIITRFKCTNIGSEEKLNSWAERWQAGKTPWHIEGVNKFLVRNFQLITNIRSGPVRVLVPLCGKALDLRWIYEQGHYVVGIEGVKKGIAEFFEEQNLAYQKTVEHGLNCYSSLDSRLKIIHADLFDMSDLSIGKFDGVWDRASLIAIEPEDRPKYAAVVNQLLDQHYAYLLNTMEYDESKCSGPPYSISQSAIQMLFGDNCLVELVEKESSLADPNYPNSFRSPWNMESCYELILLLKPRTLLSK